MNVFNPHTAICHCSTPESPQPLVWTFAFSGSEYWCAKCGANLGWMDAKRVDYSEELEAEALRRKDMAREFLRAHAITHASATLHEGKWIEPKDLPASLKDHYAEIRKRGWQWPEKGGDQ